MRSLGAGMCKILVVDDEPIVVRFVAAALLQSGHQVLTADRLRGALACVANHEEEIGLLLVDHSMSQLPGPDLVKALQRLKPQMTVLRFSGYQESDLRERGEMRPDGFFLQKPFTAQQLVGKVNEIYSP